MPAGDVLAAQLLLQGGQHDLEFGPQNGGVLFHMSFHAINVLEIPDVAEHIQLVVADGLNRHAGFDIRNVAGAARHGGHAGAGEADFGGGGEHHDNVLVAAGFGLLIYV